MSKETKKESKPENNIIFVGKREKLNKETGKFEPVARQAPQYIVDGAEKMNLPPPEEQAKGFYLEPDLAERVKSLFPDDYKTPAKK